jgi:GNAT superfamily N-acetyltransferase
MLRALIAEAGSTTAQPITAAALAQCMSGPRPEIEGVIAERAGEAIGMALFFPWLSTWQGRLYLYVQDLYVQPAQRGTGLGRRLLGAVAREGRARGCHSLLLAVATSNAPAARFYARLGFRCLESERLWLMPRAALGALIRAAESRPRPSRPSRQRTN